MKNLLVALGFLTKLPIPKGLDISDKDLAKSIMFFPVIGLLLGLILVITNTALTPLLPDRLVNLILVLLSILLTGGLHLDGFADTVDGFCAKTKNKEEILRIMKDSRIGAMGVIGLVMLLLFKYELLNSVNIRLKDTALILMCSISRWGQVFVLYFSKYAREGEGTGKPFIGHVGRQQLYLAAIFIIFLSLTAWPFKGLLVLVVITTLIWCLMKYMHTRIGGMTGDTVGAISEIVEVGTLFFVLLISSIWN